MGKKRISAALLLVLTSPAFAADLEPSAVHPAAPVAAIVPVYNWTGFYIGVHGGGGWSEWSSTDPTNPGGAGSSANGSGGVAGGQLGGNYQIGNFVVGLEGTGSWSGITLNAGGPFAGGGGFTLTLKNDYLATVAGRFGVAFDRVLLYAKGGGAFTRDKYSANNGLTGALAGSASGSFERSGWLAGVGAEWAFWQNWSVKGEYNYMGFGSLSEAPVTTGNLMVTPASVKLNIQTAIVGINYRF